jgi:hypothetical protein
VARAQLSEQFGYDLVSFQDHPYQPGFLDTWTLLTWVAAQTERIRFAGNVPMRPAPALARAAASLDPPSNGRDPRDPPAAQRLRRRGRARDQRTLHQRRWDNVFCDNVNMDPLAGLRSEPAR